MRKGKKIAALSLAGLMAVSALTACSQGETKENTADLTSGPWRQRGPGQMRQEAVRLPETELRLLYGQRTAMTWII